MLPSKKIWLYMPLKKNNIFIMKLRKISKSLQNYFFFINICLIIMYVLLMKDQITIFILLLKKNQIKIKIN